MTTEYLKRGAAYRRRRPTSPDGEQGNGADVRCVRHADAFRKRRAGRLRATIREILAAGERGIPRKARRGFSMTEMGLVLVVSAMIMQTGVELAAAYAGRMTTQRAGAVLSRVADDVETYVDRNYFALVTELEAAQGNVVERDWGALIDANLISLDAPPLSPDGGEPRLFLTLRGDSVYAVVMSFDGAGSRLSPRPDPNARFVGMVQGHDPNSLNGWDFSLDIPEIAELAGEDLIGNIGVVRQVAPDANVEPYLHRIEIPGRPDLNRMLGDLDMGGFDIRNALTVSARTLEVQDAMSVEGRLAAGIIAAEGDAVFGEVATDRVEAATVSADSATVDGKLNASEIAVGGDVEAGTVAGRDASFDNLSTARFSGGTVFLGVGRFDSVDAKRVEADRVIADRVFVGDSR